MALTDTDLEKIHGMIQSGMRQVIETLMPTLVSMDKRLGKVEDQLTDLKDEVQELRVRQDEQFLALNERVDESIELIGYYFEKCATKDEHNILSRRVEVLESRA